MLKNFNVDIKDVQHFMIHECMSLRFRRGVTIFIHLVKQSLASAAFFGILYNILRYWCFYYNFIFEKKNVKIP